MNDQENQRELDVHDWKKRHGVQFLQAVLWELGLDEEPENTLIEILESINDRMGLYVFDTASAEEHAYFVSQFAYYEEKSCISARLKRINARHKRKLEAVDNSLPWE
jgi:hypothetical protein